MMTAADIAKKWSTNLNASQASIRAGVQGVTVSPTEKAAANPDAYLAGVNRAVTSGRYQAGLRRVTLADWQNAMLTKGLTRIGPGAIAAQPKMESFMNKLIPFIQQGQRALQSTPRGDINQNIQRAVQWMQHMATFKHS